MQNKRAHQTALHFLLSGALLIGFAPIFAKKALLIGEVSPVGAGFWRMAFGSAFLALLLGATQRSKAKGILSLSVSRWGILAGLFFAMDLCLWHTSFVYTSIANASMIANFSALIVPLAGVFFFKEKISKKFMFGAVVAFLGVASLMLGSGVKPLPGNTPAGQWVGDGLALLTAFCYTGYILVVKRILRFRSALEISLVSSLWSSLFLLIFCLVTGQQIFPKQPEGWFYLVCLGVISHAMGQGFVALSLKSLPVGLTSVLLLIAPSASAFFAVVFLNEALSWVHLLGCVLVVTGIALAMRSKRA